MGNVADQLQKLEVDLEEKGNRREAVIIKQIVLLNSGALAILGVGSLGALPLPIQILFTVAIAAIGVSLISALVYFVVDYMLYRRLDSSIKIIKETVSDLDDNSAGSVVQKSISRLTFSAGVKSFWISVGAFIIVALVIASTIVLRIWFF